MAITLRTTTQAGTTNKGSTLTHAELDANFVDLLTSKLADIIDDTSPQLGGNLDVNGQKITSTSDGNIDIEPNGTGDVLLGNFKFDADQTVDAGKDNYVMTYDNGTGKISLEAASGGGGGDSVGAGNNIEITNADSAGEKTISLRSTLNQPVDAGDQQLSNLSIKNYGEIVYTSGTATGTITPDPNNGSVQKITLTGSITLNSLSNVASGDSMTLIVKQPSSGGPYTLSSSMKFAGGSKALSTDANAIDIITIFYDGTDYLASLSTNFS